MPGTFTPHYETARFGRKWGIVFRVNETTSFDQKVRYATKREAEGFTAAVQREYEAEKGRA